MFQEKAAEAVRGLKIREIQDILVFLVPPSKGTVFNKLRFAISENSTPPPLQDFLPVCTSFKLFDKFVLCPIYTVFLCFWILFLLPYSTPWCFYFLAFLQGQVFQDRDAGVIIMGETSRREDVGGAIFRRMTVRLEVGRPVSISKICFELYVVFCVLNYLYEIFFVEITHMTELFESL